MDNTPIDGLHLILVMLTEFLLLSLIIQPSFGS